MRRSLDLTSWEAANKKIRDFEIHGQEKSISVSEAAERFLSDREAMKLSRPMMTKYRNVVDELKRELGELPLRTVTPDDVRKLRESWKLAPITSQKRLEMIRKFFSFCVDSDWITKNPGKAVKSPVVNYEPTMPFTEDEMKKILWAAESIRVAHPKMPKGCEKKLIGLILLMRYSGLRISDAAMFQRSQLVRGKLFLRQQKTKQPVWVPLPKHVQKALAKCDEGNEYFFYTTVGKATTCIKEWQDRLKKVYVMAGVPDGHSHRLRDTFSVALLEKGVPLDVVSMLLGHTSIKTTEKHYAPWVKSRQTALEDAVKLAWA